jgi:hypothetical protein
MMIATLTIVGVIAFVLLMIFNWYFFHRLDVSFMEWLRNATSRQRFAAVFDIVMSIALALEFISVLFIF